ncbi:MAG TPA: RNA polymerase sigma factor SigJ [Gemmatimonadaceae bacterium]|nr:RNA polymerase sigma factor SigJ [Gemmatimonadaceae bacterium]
MTAPAPLEQFSPDEVLVHRPRLLGLAYRMLGDMDEAEDVVQETYLRWYRAAPEDVRSPEAWLVTAATRLAVDRLRRLKVERATYPGPWLPEPVPTDAPAAPAGPPPPDRNAELASDLSIALLLLLERLGPEERAAFLLREVFGVDYAEIARILERRPDAVRQMVHRARLRVRAERPRATPPPESHEVMLERFVAAIAADDAPALLSLLAPDVVVATDGGGVARAARNLLHGPDRAARFLLGVARKLGPNVTHRLGHVNGRPALLTLEDGAVVSVTTFDIDGDRLRAIYSVRNPAKLRRVLRDALPIV